MADQGLQALKLVVDVEYQQAGNFIDDLSDNIKGIEDGLYMAGKSAMAMTENTDEMLRSYQLMQGTLEERVEKLALEVKRAKELGTDYESVAMTFRELLDLANAMASNTEYTKVPLAFQQSVMQSREELIKLIKNQEDMNDQVRIFARNLNDIGLYNVGDFILKMTTLTGAIGILISTVGSYLDEQGRWITQNYTLYGSIGQVNDQMIQAQRNSSLLKEEALRAAEALGEVAITKDSFVELTGAVGALTRETKIQEAVAARFAKRMESLGYTNKEVSKQFLNIKQSMASWGLSGRDADMVLERLTADAGKLQVLMGKSGFDKYSSDMMKMASFAKQAGMTLDDLSAIYQGLEEDATQFYLLLGNQSLYEADTNKLFASMAQNADGALKDLERMPVRLRNTISKEMYGLNMSQLKMLSEVQAYAKKTGQQLNSLTFDKVKAEFEESRAVQDPLRNIAVALQDIGRALLVVLTPLIWVITGIGKLAAGFMMIPGPLRTMIGVLLFAGTASFLLSGRLTELAQSNSLLAKSFDIVKAGAGKALSGLSGLLNFIPQTIAKFFGLSTAAATAGPAMASTGTAAAGFTTKLAASMSALAPAVPVMLAVGGALLMIAGAVWIMARSITSLNEFTSALAALAVGIVGFAALAGVAALFGSVLAAVAVPLALAAGAFLLVAGAVWLLSNAFVQWAKAVEILAKINLLQFSLEFMAASGIFLAGTTVMMGALILAAAMMPLALAAGISFALLGAGLWLFSKAVAGAEDSSYATFGLRLSAALLGMSMALVIAGGLMPIILLASVSFAALGLSLMLLNLAISTDVSIAMGYGAKLSAVMLGMVPAFLVAIAMFPVVLLASITFLALGASLLLFNKAVTTDLKGAATFGVKLSGAMLALTPALLMAVAMMPLAIMAGITFVALGLTIGLFANAINKEIKQPVAFALALMAALVILTPAMILAAAMLPLALLASITFAVIGLSIRVFASALNSEIKGGVGFSLQLMAALIILSPAMILAAAMLPLALAAAITFTVIGLSIRVFSGALKSDISGALKFSWRLTMALMILSPALGMAAAMMPLVLAAALTFVAIGLSIRVFAGALNQDLSPAVGFASALTLSLMALVPALLIAGLLMPIIVMASIAFVALGVAVAILGWALSGDFSMVGKSATELAGAIDSVNAMLIGMLGVMSMAAVLAPLTIIAIPAFVLLGVAMLTLVGALAIPLAILPSLIPGMESMAQLASVMTTSMGALEVAAINMAIVAPVLAAGAIALAIASVTLLFSLVTIGAAVVLGAMMAPLAITTGIMLRILAEGLQSIIPIGPLAMMMPMIGVAILAGIGAMAAAMTMAAMMIPLAALAIVGFWLTSYGVGILVSTFQKNEVGIKLLPIIAASFALAMSAISVGMYKIIESPYLRFGAVATILTVSLTAMVAAVSLGFLIWAGANATAQGLSILAGSLEPIMQQSGLITQLPYVAGMLAIGLTVLSAGLTAGAAILPLALLAIVSFALISYALDTLLSAFSENAAGIMTFEMVTSKFTAVMGELSKGIEIAVESSYIRFMAAGVGISTGLWAILGPLNAMDSAISRLPIIASHFKNASWALSMGMWELIKSPYDKFSPAAGAVADGLGRLFYAMSAGKDVIDRLPVLADGLTSLLAVTSSSIDGQAMVNLATATNDAMLELGLGMENYAIYVEQSADRITEALSMVNAEVTAFKGSDLNQIVKNDAVITVRSEFDGEKQDQKHRQLMDVMNGIKTAVNRVADSSEAGGEDTTKEVFEDIRRMLRDYLPAIAEGQDPGLASSVNKWNAGNV